MTPTPRSPGAVAPGWFEEPSFGQRLGAVLIDAALVTLPVVALHLLLPSTTASALSLSLVASYHVVLVARNGQTVGKAVLGTKVVTMSGGATPSPMHAAVRWLVPTSPVILGAAVEAIAPLLGWAVLGIYLPMLRPPQHRGLHDRAAGTVVTRAGRAARPPR